MSNDELKNYIRPAPLQVASDEIAYHFDECCRLISEHFGPEVMDPRAKTIISLKLEEAMVWMLHTGMIRKRPEPVAADAEAPPQN